MRTNITTTSGISLVTGVILLAALVLNACSPQPVATPTSAPPATQVPPTPTINLPTSTSTPELPVPVASLDQILGTWRSHCGGGPCNLKVSADGTYRMDYVTATEGQGVTFIDGGRISFADGIFHFESTHGYCEAKPNGYFQGLLTLLDGKLFALEFVSVQPDECSDRSSMLQFQMKYVKK